METRPLGSTGLDIAVVSFGTGPLGELFGPLPEDDGVALVRGALDLGINFFDTSPYYGSAEERLGKALHGRRDEVILGTKAGRYGFSEFDFSPSRIRAGFERSLNLLGVDHVDIVQLHDIEFVELDGPLGDGIAELQRLRAEGKCRFIGVTGYPLATMERAMRQADLEVLLTYAKGTLLDDSITRVLAPLAAERNVGLINAAAVALGLLTAGGSTIEIEHPATAAIRQSAREMVRLCNSRGIDISFLANQYAIQRSGCATTVVGTRSRKHLQAAVDAATTPIDEEMLADVLALRPATDQQQWLSGLPANN